MKDYALFALFALFTLSSCSKEDTPEILELPPEHELLVGSWVGDYLVNKVDGDSVSTVPLLDTIRITTDKIIFGDRQEYDYSFQDDSALLYSIDGEELSLIEVDQSRLILVRNSWVFTSEQHYKRID